jgi:hypothetical protein
VLWTLHCMGDATMEHQDEQSPSDEAFPHRPPCRQTALLLDVNHFMARCGAVVTPFVQAAGVSAGIASVLAGIAGGALVGSGSAVAALTGDASDSSGSFIVVSHPWSSSYA